MEDLPGDGDFEDSSTRTTPEGSLPCTVHLHARCCDASGRGIDQAPTHIQPGLLLRARAEEEGTAMAEDSSCLGARDKHTLRLPNIPITKKKNKWEAE